MTDAARGNLNLALQAMNYTRSAVTIGASNKVGDVLQSLFQSSLCVTATRQVEIATPSSPVPSILRSMAAIAEHVGCGNCGEQAAIAFMFLYDRSKFPIDYASGGESVDHAFVLLGRLDASEPSDPSTWGPACVICDPWDGKYFPATMFRSEMHKGKQMIPQIEIRAGSKDNVT